VTKELKFRLRDEGGRSSIRFRPVLEELKDDIERGLVKHLWVYDRSRLFRDETDSSLFKKDYLDKFGVQFYEGELGNLVNFDSLEEKLSYDIISTLQRYENEKRSHKSNQGNRHLLRQGLDDRWYGGSVLFGYKSEDGTLSIDEEQSKWVIWMFNAFLDGVSSIDIKGGLDRNGVIPPRTKSGLWNLGTINKILANRSYIGERSFYDKELGETFSYSITPIISRSTFLRVRKEVERRQKLQDNNKKHFTLFGDYMECECGQSVGSEIKKGIRKDGHDRDGNLKQVGHRFDVFYKMKVVKDKLTYIDPDNKGSGYSVTEGRRKSSSDAVNLTQGRGKKIVSDDATNFNHGSETLRDGRIVM